MKFHIVKVFVVNLFCFSRRGSVFSCALRAQLTYMNNVLFFQCDVQSKSPEKRIFLFFFCSRKGLSRRTLGTSQECAGKLG